MKINQLISWQRFRQLMTTFSFRLYVVYFLMVGGAAWFIANRSLQAIETSVSQAAEEILVDTANLMAELAEQDATNGQLDISRFQTLIPDYLGRRLQAKIYEHTKTQPNLHLYLTDDQGKVLYDSTGQSTGKNFSRWHDVSRTLKGQYGARSSSIKHHVSTTKHAEKGLFVAAPIKVSGKIVGVLTVVKGNKHLGSYIIASTKTMSGYAIIAFIISLVAGGFITWWLSRSIKKLSRYAKQLGQGDYVPQPKIIHSEFKPLANAVESLYNDLAGKEYVENYIHTLAHELKSPLTGIIATTELLQQDLPAKDKAHFIDNIQDSAQRMTGLIERLLALAALENRHQLAAISEIDLAQCLQEILHWRHERLAAKQLTIKQTVEPITLMGEPTLIQQSLANLLDNAIDFSPSGATIEIAAHLVAATDKQPKQAKIRITDYGEGIAAFAHPRLFERFFSTPRQDTQQRSSGLGLAFVKEAVQLHQGKITLENHNNGGAVATMYLPLQQP